MTSINDIFSDLPVLNYVTFDEYIVGANTVHYKLKDFIQLYKEHKITTKNTVISDIYVNNKSTNIMLNMFKCEWKMVEGEECCISINSLIDLAEDTDVTVLVTTDQYVLDSLL